MPTQTKPRYEHPKPAPEIQTKLELSERESSGLSLRDIRCPQCSFLITRVFSDAQGHYLAKCPKCKFQKPINLAYFRRQKGVWRLKLKYYGEDYFEKLNIE